MTAKGNNAADIIRSAYEIAWQEYCSLPELMPAEKIAAPNKLRSYIQVMAAVGERDPANIAKTALGMIGEYDQIRRPKASVASAGVHLQGRTLD